jgi:hypothetical protein
MQHERPKFWWPKKFAAPNIHNTSAETLFLPLHALALVFFIKSCFIFIDA